MQVSVVVDRVEYGVIDNKVIVRCRVSFVNESGVPVGQTQLTAGTAPFFLSEKALVVLEEFHSILTSEVASFLSTLKTLPQEKKEEGGV
jgi:hypothetical protein